MVIKRPKVSAEELAAMKDGSSKSKTTTSSSGSSTPSVQQDHTALIAAVMIGLAAILIIK